MRVVILILFAVLAASCGPPADGRPHGPGPRPWAWGERVRREFVQADLPVVQRGRWDDNLPVPTLSAIRGGDIMYAGCTYPLHGKGEDEAERRAALRALQHEIHQRITGSEHPSGRPVLRLNGDREFPWDHIRDILRGVLSDSVAGLDFRWAVRQIPSTFWICQQARVRRHAGPTPEGEATHIPIDFEGWRDERNVSQVRISIRDASWTLHGTLNGADSDAVIDPDWAHVEARLGSMGPVERCLELRISEPATGVTWGHVAKVLDIALGLGYREIGFPTADLRLSLAEPEDISWTPARYPDDPVVTLPVLVLGFLGIAGALLATWAPLRSARRRKGRRSRA